MMCTVIRVLGSGFGVIGGKNVWRVFFFLFFFDCSLLLLTGLDMGYGLWFFFIWTGLGVMGYWAVLYGLGF